MSHRPLIRPTSLRPETSCEHTHTHCSVLKGDHQDLRPNCMLGKTRSPPFTTIHSRTGEEGETRGVTLQFNFGLNAFVPGSSLVPSSWLLTRVLQYCYVMAGVSLRILGGRAGGPAGTELVCLLQSETLSFWKFLKISDQYCMWFPRRRVEMASVSKHRKLNRNSDGERADGKRREEEQSDWYLQRRVGWLIDLINGFRMKLSSSFGAVKDPTGPP